MKKIFLILVLITSVFLSNAQNSTLEPDKWRAYWICVPNQSIDGYGVYCFRKTLDITTKPDTYIVHVSADNRYKLFINGQFVSMGPALGDLNNWPYETIDIAPYLQVGKNIIGAIVWNGGELRPANQFSTRTGFLMQGHTNKERAVNTGVNWKCIKDSSYSPLPQNPLGYYVADPGEIVDMNNEIGDWLSPDFDETKWMNAENITIATTKGTKTLFYSPWMLIPSSLPSMEMFPQRILKTRLSEGIAVPASFPKDKSSITIPANTTARILMDQTFLTNAYPTLIYSKGKNATVAIKYAESLYDKNLVKGNRNEIEGKKLIGRVDSIICNGKDNQNYTPLTWRTYRYVQLDISTKNEPLILNDIYGTFIGYPFKDVATFQSKNQLLDSILQIGWRTARLCAVDTYYDTPFYEQFQYVGDTRIQAMISYYSTGDDRLAKNAIDLIDDSRLPEGITLSRYPSNKVQIIPPFSLMWIGMIYDYYYYRPDTTDFIKSKLNGIRQVLNYFSTFQQEDGSLKDIPYWNFTDWPDGNASKWKFGTAPVGNNEESAALDFQLLWAYQWATELENHFGNSWYADNDSKKAEQLKQTIIKKYWDSDKKLFADTEDKDSYSQQVNIFAILTETIEGQDATDLFQKIMENKDIAQASIYFKYYLNRAMAKVGLGDDYLNHLDIWKKDISFGLTTWSEDSKVEISRSDCHAWGASPNIEFYRIVLGIDTDAPGFSKVKIEPHLGNLTQASGSIPHPNGMIKVVYSVNKMGNVNADISLPANVSGSFVWKGQTKELNSGENKIKL